MLQNATKEELDMIIKLQDEITKIIKPDEDITNLIDLLIKKLENLTKFISQ
jgi:hypothetical protein